MQRPNQALIGGEWVNGRAGRTFPVFCPWDGGLLAEVTDCSTEDVQRALEAAAEAFQGWRKYTPKARSVILRRIGDLLLEHKDEMAELMTAEQGKPHGEAAGEVAFSASFFHFYAGECERPEGEVIPSSVAGKQFLTVREPLGVAALVCPWNFPLGMPARKLSAALAAGCTAVVKPAEDTPLICLALAQFATQAGLPPGVLNVTPVSRERVEEVGALLCAAPEVSLLSFTGSTEVGRKLYSAAGLTVKRVALELGGNAPFLVFPSADLGAAVEGLMAAKFRNAGQTCVTANRILVHASVYPEFLARFRSRAGALVTGDGSLPGTQLGPIINARQLGRIQRIVQESVAAGAQVDLGGSAAGSVFQPTILTAVKTDAPCWQEEIFGPVAAIRQFDTEEEAVTEANRTDRGLAAFFYSQDLAQVWRVARALEAGMVGVNDVGISTPQTPFGGYKTSGIGKEGSRHGLEEYSNLKMIDLGGL